MFSLTWHGCSRSGARNKKSVRHCLLTGIGGESHCQFRGSEYYWHRLNYFFKNKHKFISLLFQSQQRELFQTMARATLRSLKPSYRRNGVCHQCVRSLLLSLFWSQFHRVCPLKCPAILRRIKKELVENMKRITLLPLILRWHPIISWDTFPNHKNGV